jgi:hypothetical protein
MTRQLCIKKEKKFIYAILFPNTDQVSGVWYSKISQVYAINDEDITICEVIQDGKDSYCSFLGYDAVKSGRSVPAFWRNILSLPEDRYTRFFSNVSICLPDYMVSHPGRQSSSINRTVY